VRVEQEVDVGQRAKCGEERGFLPEATPRARPRLVGAGDGRDDPAGGDATEDVAYGRRHVVHSQVPGDADSAWSHRRPARSFRAVPGGEAKV
jgi:hypothetical protein